MLENLGEELARIVTVYKNRADMLRWNAKSSFSLADVVRHHLFNKAEAAGFTPIPNLAVLHWNIDVACLRGYRLERLFLVREKPTEDYRQLLLFPRSVEKVLVAMKRNCVPEDTTDMLVIQIPRRPTQVVQRTMSVRQIREAFFAAFREIYQFEPVISHAQAIGTASRVAAWWGAHAAGLNFEKYCVWLFRRLMGNANRRDVVPSFHEVMDRDALQTFRLEQRRANDSGQWTGGGWTSLGG